MLELNKLRCDYSSAMVLDLPSQPYTSFYKTYPISIHLQSECIQIRDSLQLRTHKLSILLSAERLGTLDRCANSAVNDELRKDTKCTGDTKEHRVEVLLSETVILQQNTAVRIDVGVRVLGLRFRY